jgi:hypothetical protein
MPSLVDLGLAPNLQAVVGLPMAEIVRRAAMVSADGHFAARVGGGGNGAALPALRARPGGRAADV